MRGMDEPPTEIQEPLPLPRCPHCGTELENPALYNWQFNSPPLTQIILAVYCSNLECRKIIGSQIMMASAQPEEPRVMRPV